MKYLPIVVFQLLLMSLCHAQEKTTPQSWLWEVSGNGLNANSYLFGSAHINDPRIFNFDDSLYHALSTSKQFANEVDFQAVDSIIIVEVLDKLSLEEKSTTKGGEKKSDSYEYMDMYGKATVLDAYLHRVAINLGLSSHGLEAIADQVDLLDNIAETDDEFKFKSIWYEAFIDAYVNGDIPALTRLMVDDMNSDYRMTERNIIQANSFEKLAERAPTFAVVGAAHLFGNRNVLELLEERGYHARRVNLGQASSQIDRLYSLPATEDWHKIEDANLGFNLQSNLNEELLSLEKGAFHFSMEVAKGLAYATTVLISSSNSAEEFLQLVKRDFFPDTLNLKQDAKRIEGDFTVYDFSNYSEESAFKARVFHSNSLSVLQLVLGFAHSSLEDRHVQRYFDGLEIEGPKRLSMSLQYAKEDKFQYLFPENMPLVEKTYVHPSFPERGEASIRYKNYIDPFSRDDYLVKYSALPSGVTFLEPYQDHKLVVNQIAELSKTKVIKLDFLELQNYLAADAILIDSFDNEFYLRNLIRGSCMYLLFQKSPQKNRNTEFLESLALSEVDFDVTSRYTYSNAGFSISAPLDTYSYQTEDEGTTIDNTSFNINDSGVVVDLEFNKYGAYQEFNLHDSMFIVENFIDQDLVDTLIRFEMYEYEETCPGYLMQYQDDSTFYYSTNIGIYCNQHFVTLDIITPAALQKTDYVDKIIESIHFDLDSESVEWFSKRKAPLILKDLESKDSTTFVAALDAFNDYEEFNEGDLAQIFQLLDKELLDEEEVYNAKYDIVSALHAFDTPEVEQVVHDYYLSSNNDGVKERILESFSLRSSDSYVDNLLDLLSKSTTSQSLPENIYDVFKDSTELLAIYYPRLKLITDKGIASDQFLALIVEELFRDTIHPFIEADSSWIRSKMVEQISHYTQQLQTDTTTNIDLYLMEYLLVKNDREIERKLFPQIANSNDVYGKFRIVINQIIKNEEVPHELLFDVMKDDYYRYWLMVQYASLEKSLPEKYMDKVEVAGIVMKYYIYEKLDYECDSCTLIRPLSEKETSHQEMLFMRCDGAEEGQYYLGCVGPFDRNGEYDFDNGKSVYYNSLQSEENPEVLIQPLLDHLNKD